MNYKKMKKYFNDEYEFRVSRRDDLPLVLEFIDKYWKKDHALVLSRPLMDWQHLDRIRNRYNFFIAVHRKSGEIHALQGIIPTSQYDSEIDNPLIMGAIWKVRDDAVLPGLGMMVRLYGETQIVGCARGGLGLSSDASCIDKHMNFRHGTCNHYYILNPTITSFKIAGNVNRKCLFKREINFTDKQFIDISEDDYLSLPNDVFMSVPFFKSKNYYVNRFFRHPVYDYKATLISDTSGGALGIFFWRFCVNEGSCCMRIVDMFMKPGALSGNHANFERLLQTHNAEYVDCYNIGYPESEFYAAGFSERHQSDIIIPNYFEPFVQENCELSYSLSISGINLNPLLFKADGDQDRPNRV